MTQANMAGDLIALKQVTSLTTRSMMVKFPVRLESHELIHLLKFTSLMPCLFVTEVHTMLPTGTEINSIQMSCTLQVTVCFCFLEHLRLRP